MKKHLLTMGVILAFGINTLQAQEKTNSQVSSNTPVKTEKLETEKRKEASLSQPGLKPASSITGQQPTVATRKQQEQQNSQPKK